MATPAEPKVEPMRVVPSQTSDFFSAKQQITTSHTSELVIALCGPIGSPLHKVAEAIKSKLEKDFAYERCEIIRLSQIIAENAAEIPDAPRYNYIKALIGKGNELRETYGSSVLAELAIHKISVERQKVKAGEDAKRFRPKRVCHIIDSVKNQEELEILQLVYREMVYFVGVYAPLPARVKSLEKAGMTLKEIYDLIDMDSGEELDHGQTVRKTFPNADFFIRIDNDTDTQVTSKVERFLHLILGTKIMTPTYGEVAMYLAASAAGNSACLSRQVGAALTDKNGEVISVGWNDVPTFGGGLYVSNPGVDPQSEKDRRCWNIDGGVCFNDKEKRLLTELMVEELVSQNLVDSSKRNTAVDLVLKSSKVKDLIEFSRAVHAEMHAIISAGRLGGDKIRGGKIYITTYPCHSCARHIVAAGILEVYYIEPYRKSLATKLHDDAITEDEADESKLRILPYDGVAPNRYLKLFRAPPDTRKSGGIMTKVDQKSAGPRFMKTLEALPTLEALVVKGLVEKRLVEVESRDA